MLGFWFVAWACAIVRYRPGRPVDFRLSYCWWLSVTTLGVFTAASVKAAGEMNWPVAGYVSGLVLVTAAGAERWNACTISQRRRWRWTAGFAAGLGLAITTLALFPTWFRPVLVVVSGPVSERHPIPLRRFDPTCRLRGWAHLGQVVKRCVADHAEAGRPPVVAAASWSVAGELAFYTRSPGEIYCLGPGLGRRKSQYDLWRPNPLSDPEAFLGRTFVYVGDVTPEVVAAFDRLEPTRWVTYREAGQPVAAWPVTIARGYRGFARTPLSVSY